MSEDTGNVLSERYVRNPDVVVREEDEDGALLFYPETNGVRVLNATGIQVWNLCDGGHDLQSVIDEIKSSFDGAPEGAVERDVLQFVRSLADASFLGLQECMN